MILALLFAVQAIQPPIQPLLTTVDGFPISALPEQSLPAKGCAIFLWSRTPSQALIAYAAADPATLRVSIDGKVHDLNISGQNGIGGFGFSQTTEYKDKDVTATLDLKITRGAIGGTRISDATLKIDRDGQDDFTVPVGGYMACAQ